MWPLLEGDSPLLFSWGSETAVRVREWITALWIQALGLNVDKPSEAQRNPRPRDLASVMTEEEPSFCT